MGKAPNADMQKLNAYAVELTAFAERYGIVYEFPQQVKEGMIRKAQLRHEPIELIIAEDRQRAVVEFPQILEENPAFKSCAATIH